ncbi:MAG TPA: MerR family transcriptional regulator [Syntrophomonadaceae bacterium]|nr:MerR family transcriptional regulator [Syntrophomonadaceae bacterium]
MLTIGEFSKICRVSTKTLRYYDEIGLLKPIQVNDETGYRYYQTTQLKDILLITRLKLYQFSLPEIAMIIARKDSAYLADSIRLKREAVLKQLDKQEYILRQMEQDIEKIERSIDIMSKNIVVNLIETQPMRIYSLRKYISMNDFEAFFGELFAGIYKKGIQVNGTCLSIYHSEEHNPEHFDVEVGVGVAGGDDPHIRMLDGGLCCYATHVGRYDDFTEIYAGLTEWIEREGYTFAAPPYEKYVKGYQDKVSPDEFVTEIYFPIKKR